MYFNKLFHILILHVTCKKKTIFEKNKLNNYCFTRTYTGSTLNFNYLDYILYETLNVYVHKNDTVILPQFIIQNTYAHILKKLTLEHHDTFIRRFCLFSLEKDRNRTDNAHHIISTIRRQLKSIVSHPQQY